jgi:hypothetical protein
MATRKKTAKPGLFMDVVTLSGQLLAATSLGHSVPSRALGKCPARSKYPKSVVLQNSGSI